MNKLALLVPLLALLLSCGLLEQSTGGTPMMSVEPPHQQHMGGMISMEELIAARDTIVRATLTATSSEVVLSPDPFIDMPANRYWILRKFTFTANEYLKGSGPASFTAVWAYNRTYSTEAEAEKVKARILSTADGNWENTSGEAILFLHSGTNSGDNSILNDVFSRDAHLFMAWADPYGTDDSYSLHSNIMRVWLPQVSPGESEYLLALPPTDDTITLASLKRMITDITAELAVNTSEEYQRCVVRKYEELRRARNWLEDTGYRYTTWPQDAHLVASGAPAGTEIARRTFSWGDYPDPAPTWMRSGADADLFSVGVATSSAPDIAFLERVATARPLIPGEYTFVVEDNWQALQQCGYVAHTDFTVEATAQEGATHEFFFDPVTVGSAVAADVSNGVLKPTSFTVTNGTPATIESISYESGKVRVKVVPWDVMSGHVLDFIELDGTVSLSLNVTNSAVEDSTDTLTWSVSSQPWEDGDRLMVRIRRAAP